MPEEKITKDDPPSYIQETEIQKIIVIHMGQILDVTKDYVRTWIDLEGNPYKYEFRGAEYQGYHDPHEVVITK